MSERWPDLAGRLVDGRHVLPVRVYFEDTDFSGVVYHASYVRFMERGRSDFMRLAGADHAELFAGEESIAFAVRRMSIEFERPARIDDVLEVVTGVREMRGASMLLAQEVRRGDQLLVSAEVQVALVTATGRARRIPLALRQVLGAAAEG
ncbi:tol-pal system-associated acyl-CoA thioesterase [Lutibaculum baratangense]|uniref:4-hydroxybenzoyl-CoA thioesterase n=1 Tax=Lutibaculum baratangense AMV1 TaxID=631454 RepID=V4TJV1_9HYPH|nr:tol-pal system-associated acyl-CoA thioesterase [Lutibaculum baratangense]ESR26178.1 4-hydroxybenzoyl-CoA thioesterase [Lutibaculum baratangense AMV1]